VKDDLCEEESDDEEGVGRIGDVELVRLEEEVGGLTKDVDSECGSCNEEKGMGFRFMFQVGNLEGQGEG
jgi:hypothetical protein